MDRAWPVPELQRPRRRRGGALAGLPAPSFLAPSFLAPSFLAASLIATGPAVAGAWAAGARAETAGGEARLREIERAAAADREKAAALTARAERFQAEIRDLRTQAIGVAKTAQDLEEELSAIELTLAAFRLEERHKLDALRAGQGSFYDTLGALQRIAVRPPEALLLAPGSPITTVRSAILLRVAVPAIENRVGAVRGALLELRSLRESIAARQGELSETMAALETERRRLDTLIVRKTELIGATDAAAQAARKRAERLAGEAGDLRDLIVKLEQEAKERAEREARERVERRKRLEADAEARRLALARAEEEARAAASERQAASRRPAGRPTTLRDMVNLAKPNNVRPFPDSPSIASLMMPARGDILARYGQRRRTDGASSKGITIGTRSAAQVVAPFDGRVAYAGKFRGYGQILIIEHGGRYHTLLAGMDRVDAVVGQWLLAGEPVGAMVTSPGIRPELYLELRRTGRPINPLPWLATNSEKVQG